VTCVGLIKQNRDETKRREAEGTAGEQGRRPKEFFVEDEEERRTRAVRDSSSASLGRGVVYW
jgi:hypothetical protein